jgi:hypothetical protein
MFDSDARTNNFFSPFEFEADANEGQIFGLEVRNDAKLIGNVYLYCDSLSQLLETINDETPILNTKGEKKGVMRYSLVPKILDAKGNDYSLMDIEDVNELIG